MNILVITNLFHPDRGGGASVFSDLCFGLSERGFNITVHTTYPYYPEWKNKSQANLFKISKETTHKINIERYGLFIPKNPSNLVSRLLYEFSFFLSLIRSLKSKFVNDYDLIMVYCPLLSTVAFAVVRKIIYGTKLWINVQDIPADAAMASGISKSNLFNYFASIVQNYLFNQGDIWSTISPVMVKRLKGFANIFNKKIVYLPNWLNLSLEREIDALPGKRNNRFSAPLKLLYAGNIGKKQDLLKFCKIMKIQRFDFEFIIHANGAEADKVRQWVISENDNRFQFGPFLNEANFAKALNEADFFVITEKNDVGASFIPSKLIPAISSGTPILAVCDSESPLGQEMKHSNLGISIAWEDLDRINEFLCSLYKKSKKVTDFQTNCINRSYFFKRDRVIGEFEEKIQEIVHQNN